MKKKKKIIICFEWEFMAKSERRDQKKKKKRDLTEFTVEHLLIFFRRDFTENFQTFTRFKIHSLNLKKLSI
jgi:hypothetical protein